MALIVRKFGETIELRYHDVPLFKQPEALEAIRSTMLAHLELALADVAGHVSDEAPVNLGALAQSIAGEVTGTTLDDMSGRVFSPLPYAIVIDQGRTPGARMPPIDAIKLWIERKGIHKASNTNFGALSGLDQEAELESLAWAIAKSIQRKGIEGRQFFAAGWAAAERRVEGIFEIMADAIAVVLVTDQGGTARPRAATAFTSRLL